MMGNTDGPPETDYPQLHSKAAVAGERVTGMKGDSDKKHRDVPRRDTIFGTKIDATRNELRGTVNDLSLDLKDLREGRRARGVAPAVSPPSPQSSKILRSNMNPHHTTILVRGGEGRHLRAEAAPRASTMNKASKGRAIFLAAPAFGCPRKSSDCVVLRMPRTQARPIRMQVASPTMRLAGTRARLSSHLEASVPRDKPTRSALGANLADKDIGWSGYPNSRSGPLEARNVPPGKSFRDTCDENATAYTS